jgi:hypothetical protein
MKVLFYVLGALALTLFVDSIALFFVALGLGAFGAITPAIISVCTSGAAMSMLGVWGKRRGWTS